MGYGPEHVLAWGAANTALDYRDLMIHWIGCVAISKMGAFFNAQAIFIQQCFISGMLVLKKPHNPML